MAGKVFTDTSVGVTHGFIAAWDRREFKHHPSPLCQVIKPAQRSALMAPYNSFHKQSRYSTYSFFYGIKKAGVSSLENTPR